MSLTPGQGLTQGQVLQNRYRIVTLLGQGGMGAVYRTWDLRLEMPVALKEMVPQPGLDAATLDSLREQFKREAAVLARMRHTHLVGVIDYFIENGNTYLVMDFVEGESLADRIQRQGPLAESAVLGIARNLLDALAYCHGQGILHRDIKPGNIILRPTGEAVLVDFGLVKLWDPNDPRTKTAIRGAGTAEYAPLEQYGSGGTHTGPHSDIYSLGATLYHALIGAAPPTVTDRMLDPGSLRAPTEVRGDVSARTEAAVLTAIAIQPGERLQTAEELHWALTQGGEPGGLPPAGSASTQTNVMLDTLSEQPAAVSASPQARRVPAWILAAAALVMVGLLGLGMGRLFGHGGEAPAAAPTSTASPTPMPAPGLGSTRTLEADGMVQVWVPGGSFQMGSESVVVMKNRCIG